MSKHPVQADGKGSTQNHADGVSDTDTHGKHGGSDSQGGSYPNPHRGKKPEAQPESFMGHGGQTKMAYHGPQQLGDEPVDNDENGNAPTKAG